MIFKISAVLLLALATVSCNKYHPRPPPKHHYNPTHAPEKYNPDEHHPEHHPEHPSGYGYGNNKDYDEELIICDRRPIWIENKVNSIYELQTDLNGYWNIISVTLNFDSYNMPSTIGEEIGEDCNSTKGSDKFEDFIEELRAISERDHPSFREEIVAVDIRLNLVKKCNDEKYQAGYNLALALADKLFLNGDGKSELKIIIRIDSLADYQAADGYNAALVDGSLGDSVCDLLNERTGWTVHYNADLFTAQYRFWQQKNINNIIFSSGRSNCLPIIYRNLVLNIAVRDYYVDVNVYVVNKVLIWDIDNPEDVDDALELRVDIIRTNDPTTVWNQLQKLRYLYEYTLATRNDDLFGKTPNNCTVNGEPVPTDI